MLWNGNSWIPVNLKKLEQLAWVKQSHKPPMTGNGNHTTYLWWFGGWLMALFYPHYWGRWIVAARNRAALVKWWVKSRWEWPQGPRSHPSRKFNKHESNMFYFQKVTIQSPKLNLSFVQLPAFSWYILSGSTMLITHQAVRETRTEDTFTSIRISGC